jgi:ABC-type nitrate/sulfonate/bicarbonate transport system substrate-binding protein
VSRRGFLGWCSGALLVPALAACAQSRAPAAPPPAAPAGAPAGQTATPPALGTMRINYNAIAGVMSGIWMAYETGAWQECGIDPELSNINSSSRVLPALIANDLDGSALDVMAGVRGLASGSDVVFLAAMSNRQLFSVFARPDLRPADLPGKQWGITRVGASTDVAAHLALEYWGVPDDDIMFIQLGAAANTLAALESGQIDVATLGPPNTLQAQAAGFKELINLEEEGPAFPSVGIAMMQSLRTERPELAYAFVKGYALGVQRLRANKDATLAAYHKYLQTDDPEVLDATYDLAKRYLAWPPVIPADGLDRVRHAVATQEDPRAADLTDAQVFDSQFVDQLQMEGLFG